MNQAFWAFYFLAKLALHYSGALRLHVLPNLALLVLAMPFAPGESRFPFLRRLRQGAALAAGAALLWYDSYLPPFLFCLRFARDNPNALSWGFMNEVAAGFVSARGLLGLCALAALAAAVGRRRLHLTPAVFLALLLVPVLELRQPREEIAREAARFYEAERGRRVAIPPAQGAPFDLVILHVCSLSWDDLAASGTPRPRLLEGASYLFTRFNSATSYSGPASLRLMRAPCGHVPHGELYSPWPKGCALMPALRASGFDTFSAVNFPKASMGMVQNLVARAGVDEPVPNENMPVRWLNYDGETVVEDYAMLSRLWGRRQESRAPRAALYYDTVSMHGGVHDDKPEWWKDPKGAVYLRAQEALGRDLERFYNDIEASGRSAVVLLVAEHGRALRGSALQAESLRDIPLPGITRVPAAVRFVGPLFEGAPRGRVADQPMSYLALAQLMADLIGDPSLGRSPDRLEAAVAALPRTKAVSETESWKVLEHDGAAYLYGKDRSWRPLPPDPAVVLGPVPPLLAGSAP